MVADYIKETDNHVMYRVTPVFEGESLVASGVLMEAESVEDHGEGVKFNVYVYNVQPGITIDYSTGKAVLSDADASAGTGKTSGNTEKKMYVLNENTKKFHTPECSGVKDIKEGNKKTFTELQKVMPGVAVLGLACVVGGVVSSQGDKFFESGVVIFVAVFLHNGLGYLLGYGAGRLTGMNTAKKRTISIEVGMQNAGLATNLATTTAQFAVAPESAIICAVSCTWHSISGTLLAGLFAAYDKRKAGKPANKKQAAENVA